MSLVMLFSPPPPAGMEGGDGEFIGDGREEAEEGRGEREKERETS